MFNASAFDGAPAQPGLGALLPMLRRLVSGRLPAAGTRRMRAESTSDDRTGSVHQCRRGPGLRAAPGPATSGPESFLWHSTALREAGATLPRRSACCFLRGENTKTQRGWPSFRLLMQELLLEKGRQTSGFLRINFARNSPQNVLWFPIISAFLFAYCFKGRKSMTTAALFRYTSVRGSRHIL